MTYHNAIYATGHHEGKLTAGDIQAAATKAGVNATNEASHPAVLEKKGTLAGSLGLTGTPGIIVMPLTGTTPDNITLFPEAVTAEKQLAAIRKAGGAK